MIEVRDLSKRFGNTVAVDQLSFDVTPGVVTGFLGPNGAGKSTTMRLILGLDNPTGGSVTVNGRSYRELPAPMHKVGALLDAKAIHGGRTARQHLRWLAQAGGVPRTRADELLDLLGLTGVAGKRVGGFSLGMSQRLGIATALLGNPPTLLFDEPVNGLDPEGVLFVRTLLKRLASEGRTVLVSSHLMSEMEETADHVLVIGRGRLLADMSIAEFTQRSSSSHVRVVSPEVTRLTPLLLEGPGSVVTSSGHGALIVVGVDAARIGDIAATHCIRLHELTPRTSIPILYPLIGVIFGGILQPILGVRAVASEYSTGMMRLTLTATPRRGRVLLAKALVAAAVTLVGASIAAAGVFSPVRRSSASTVWIRPASPRPTRCARSSASLRSPPCFP